MTSAASVSQRIIVVAPRGRDANIACDILDEAGLAAIARRDLLDLIEALAEGVGAVVIAEEGLQSPSYPDLVRWIEQQPAWSDLPIVLIAHRGGGIERNPSARRLAAALGNVSFLERPFHPTTLVSMAEAALRARRRQYEARERMEAIRAAEALLERRVAERTSELESANRQLAEQIAERERMEGVLRQAQRLDAVGQLTSGIAHDFNNMLQVIIGNLDTLLRRLPQESERLRRSAAQALAGAQRAASLTRRLLAFSRRYPLDPKPLNVNALVTGLSELIHRTLGETFSVETVLAAGLWQVEADANELEAAMLNLAVNSRDAMTGGGRLTIETANTHIDDLYTSRHPDVVPGQYVTICVSDTGKGMDESTVSRAFEPFFTTKPVGSGTGLGLSQVYGFVKQSGGHVKIYSEVGEGTTVKIYLPRLADPQSVVEEQALESPPPEADAGETILVVEDDDDVRTYSVEILRELGYRVIEAHDGPSALRLLERQTRVDLLFTDVVLPGGMTGAQTADQARMLRPGLKVLFTTGYARNAIIHHGRLDKGVRLVTKPFGSAELAVKVRDVLDAGA